MRTRTLVLIVAAIGLLSTTLTAAGYSWQNAPAPPQETAMGRNDVRDEPNHDWDRPGDIHRGPSNGFASCGTLDGTDARSCQGADGTLVLEAYYETNAGAANADLNNILRRATFGAVGQDDRIYPGLGYFGAYWGWWNDKGGGASLQEDETARSILETSPNAAIDDAHDNETKAWDEFVWRGDNPWASKHGHDPKPGDTLHLFIQPGTWHNVIFQAPYPPPVFDLDCCGYLLRDDHDDGSVPDMEYSDRTGADLTVEDQGWVTGAGFPHINYDASLLVTTRATTTVNAPQGLDGYIRTDADYWDVDRYETVNPAAESLYTATVWDPGNTEDGSDDTGPKDTAKEMYTSFALQSEDQLAEWRDQVTRPSSPFQGLALDAAGEKPRPHEPNTGGDAYPGANHDATTTYGIVAGNKTDYYEPGDRQTYQGYQEAEEVFLDIRPGYGVPAYPSQRYSFNLAPAPAVDSPVNQGDQRTASPGFLSFRGNLGTWWDTTEDTFVGNLAEFGRTTSREDPYRNGTVDDPNDYGDHPDNHNGNPAKDHQWTPEWRGLCGGGDVEITAVPTNDDRRWGETGVYVVRDSDGGSNPYDDAADDALDDRSRHVTEGPIDIGIGCDSHNAKEGEWLGKDYILVPAGNPTFTVKVTSVGTVLEDRRDRNLDEPLQGDTVTDVDYVEAWS